MSDRSSEYRDSRWQQKRLEIMERDGWKCRSCGKGGKDAEGVTLNVHHACYVKGKKPWEYPSEMLFTYCQECHEERHELQNCITIGLAGMNRLQFGGVYNCVYAFDVKRFFELMASDKCRFIGDALSHMAKVVIGAEGEKHA